ncbi:MAG: MOSC domain-containing protein [Acidimicrobiales bacterium]|jgi:MOSC domain-containing protein YiiM
MAASVVGLHIAPATRLDMRSVESVDIEAGAGIVGDRYHGTTHRHVSVQSCEELAEAETDFGASLDPLLTRRNITISHGRVPRTPGHRWKIGPVELEVVRDAAPCKLLDDTLGVGARTAMRRRAGVICRVVSGGTLTLGSLVDVGQSVAAD